MVRDRGGLGGLGKIIALVILAALYAGVVSYILLPPLPAPYTPPIAETGDFVEVDYRGWFPDNQRTFDTSILAVAKDNATYPKAASFQYRTGGAQYSPLQFTLGCSSGAACPRAAFQNAVRGLHAGDTKTIELQPKDAYGLADPAKIHVRPLLEDVVVTETMNTTTFQQRYGQGPVDGSIVRDTTWGWNVTVNVAGDLVTIRNSPTVGQLITVATKWHARVLSIDDSANQGLGDIRVQHLLTSADVRAFVATDRTGNFLIDAVDSAAATFTTNYNNEVIGRTLDFSITLVSIRKAR